MFINQFIILFNGLHVIQNKCVPLPTEILIYIIIRLGMRVFILLAALFSFTLLSAQNEGHPEDRQVDMDDPTFVPTVKVGKVLDKETAYNTWR